MSGVPTPPPAAAPTPPPATLPAWYAGLDPEHIGHVQTKGWDKLDAPAAAAEMAKAHRNAEKLVGVPAEQVLRLPKPEDADAWKSVWQKLGAPDKPEGYDFKAVEFADAETTTKFHDAFRSTASELSMPKAMAEKFAEAVGKTLADQGKTTAAEASAGLVAEKAKLLESWGPEDGSRFRGNMYVADQAAERLGVTQEQMAKLKEGLGGAAVAEMFRKIGAGMGEDKFVRDPGPGGRDAMTRDQAVARKIELLGDGRPGSGDKDFQKRYMTGDTAARREVQALTLLIAEGAP